MFRCPPSNRFTLAMVVAACALAAASAVPPSARAADPALQPPAVAARLSGMSGPAATGIMVQSLADAEPNNLLAEFVALGTSRAPSAISRSGLPPLSPASIYLPGEPTLAPGEHAAFIHAEKAIAGMARTDWWATGGATATRASVAAREVVLPLVTLAHYGQTSRIAVQNASTTASATVELSYYAAGRSGVAATQVLDVPPFSAVDIAPPASLATGPAGFVGVVHVASTEPVAVHSLVDLSHKALGVYDVEGVPADNASATLYAPVVRRRFLDRELASTAFVVANASNTPARVDVAYHGRHGACAGLMAAHDPVTIPPRSSHVFYQGGDGSLADKNHLPDGCIASAVARSDGALLAGVVVDVTEGGDGPAAAYTAMGIADIDTVVAVPLVRACHPDTSPIVTAVTLMNTGAETAHVSPSGGDIFGDPLIACGAACTITIAPMEIATFMLGARNISCKPGASQVGAALFTSAQPLAVVAHEFVFDRRLDSVAFNGVPASPSRRSLEAWFPRVAKTP